MKRPADVDESRASARHTICFSQGMFDLASAWAKAEGRTVGSSLTYALECGLRHLMAEGVIPASAIEAYEAKARERFNS
jgi:hypothetical protein